MHTIKDFLLPTQCRLCYWGRLSLVMVIGIALGVLSVVLPIYHADLAFILHGWVFLPVVVAAPFVLVSGLMLWLKLSLRD